MKKTLLALGLSCAGLMSANAHADVIGLYIGGQAWDNQASGRFGESNNMEDFNLADETQSSFYIAVEHPIPLIPNVRISHNTLDTTGATSLTSDFDFGDQTFMQGTNVSTVFDVNYNDFTLYYELFDNGLFSFDFGLTARDFNGEVSVTGVVQGTDANDNPISQTLVGQESLSEIVPMFYASAMVGLPLTGLDLFAQGNFLSIDDHVLYDYQAGISYALIDNMIVDVNLTAGYKSVKLELDDLDDLYTDIEFDGVFAGVVVHF